jgi:ATP-dependent Zn protease
MHNVDDRYLTACHEAGHAVAALMRGGGEVTSISIEPTADHLGITHTRRKTFDNSGRCRGAWLARISTQEVRHNLVR